MVEATAPRATGSDEFWRAFGERLRDVLDLETWGPGEDLARLYQRLETEVGDALAQESRIAAYLRAEVLPRLAARQAAPPGAGIFRVTPAQVARVHTGLLFPGAVEACDGAMAALDTLPVAIAQVGVGLVSYRGDQGTWVQRLFRRDLRLTGDDPAEEARQLLEARTRRGGLGRDERRDTLNQLVRRGLMSYAERAALVRHSTARWRVGHGVPVPLELLTGSGSPDLLAASLDVLNELITGHRRFLYVPSEPRESVLITLGHALRPLEFAVVETARDRLEAMSDRSFPMGPALAARRRAFVEEVGDRIALGVFRASRAAPPHLFYAHVDHIHEAGLIAIADSALQEHRGFPLLIDLAETICRAAFGAELFNATAQAVYTAHGAPFRFMSERLSRP
ncbi:MAG: hypothetical protein U0531_08760 [Dehalococcoidia bacterium]